MANLLFKRIVGYTRTVTNGVRLKGLIKEFSHGRYGRESWVEMGGYGMVDPNVFDAVGPFFTARECTLPDGYS